MQQCCYQKCKLIFSVEGDFNSFICQWTTGLNRPHENYVAIFNPFTILIYKRDLKIWETSMYYYLYNWEFGILK